jgi:ABC-type bacteriocin/lantibiotic exporter with double-glycine peptidase domain
VAVSAALTIIMNALMQATFAVPTFLQAMTVLDRARPILDEAPELDARRDTPRRLQGAVEVRHVSFRYGTAGPLVLDDVSLRIEPGEFAAVVGPSGSGKSTLLRLLLGFERPTAGSILYDEQDLQDLDLAAVRRQLGVVLQDARLIPGATIFENIAGSRRCSLDDAWWAATAAGLAADIEQMPMGMHTFVAEGAKTFSGGQRQRLLVARAIVSRPNILLLDEATSSLDNPTQEQVARSVEQLRVTRVVIAHRLSTIMNADRIFVLDRGVVVQRGTYDQLMAVPGLFSELARRQTA